MRHHHQAFAISAMNPGANDKVKEEVRENGGHDRECEIERRASEFEDQQREGKAGKRTSKRGDRLSCPEFPEISPEAWLDLRRSAHGHDALLLLERCVELMDSLLYPVYATFS